MPGGFVGDRAVKLGDLEAGEEYAVRRGNYGSYGRLRMLGVETVEVQTYSAGAFRSHAKPTRLARMAIVGDPEKWGYSPGYRIPAPKEKGELFVPGRDVVVTWAVHAEGEAARERYRAEKAEEQARVDARAEDFEVRMTALLGERVEVKTMGSLSVTVDAVAVGRLIELAEGKL